MTKKEIQKFTLNIYRILYHLPVHCVYYQRTCIHFKRHPKSKVTAVLNQQSDFFGFLNAMTILRITYGKCITSKRSSNF